ncbi:hypothetical protein [Nocardia nova]|uniref:SLOG cluster 4 domain-containing protein n=1 Tax=Nocardia nova TaxID=37330 RepID=UPI00215773BF|nr:hypothetical protein [Nocardia nova]
MPPVQVAVCGPRDCTDAEAAIAWEVGRLLAGAGAVVLCGGGTGVMAAVAEGAAVEGSHRAANAAEAVAFAVAGTRPGG